MAEHPHQIQVHPLHGKPHQPLHGMKGLFPEKGGSGGPTTSQVVAVVTLFPITGILLTLAGLTLAGTLIGLAVTVPLFVICSPVLVPAAIVIGLAVTGFLTSGVFGLTALSSFSWIFNYFRQVREVVPEQMEKAKRRMQDVTGYVGQRTKDAGQGIQNKAHEGGRT